MKTFALLTFFLFGFLACNHKSPIHTTVETTHFIETTNWLILPFPEVYQVHGVYGNIDSILLVATTHGIYRTEDKGESWQKAIYAYGNATVNFISSGDTLYGLTGMLGHFATFRYVCCVSFRLQ